MAVVLREAVPADVAAAARLFEARDGREFPHPAVADTVCGFDRTRCLAILAWDGDRPVGMSMVYPRRVRAPRGEAQVGYWGNLFVHPDYRRAMVYPRLPLAMFRAARAAGCDYVLTATRRRESSGVHLQLGCRQIGELPVLMKPLRPAALLAQRKGVKLAAGLPGRAADGLFGALARLYTLPDELRGGTEELAWTSPELDQIAALLSGDAAARAHQPWSAPGLRDRYRGNLEGDPYTCLVAREQGRVVAAAIVRRADRGGTPAGVIMDLVAAPGHEAAVRRVLAHAERMAVAEGAAVMLHLDGLAGPVRRQLTRLGYLRSPELYQLLVWPADVTPADPALLDPTRFRFPFADHDAF